MPLGTAGRIASTTTATATTTTLCPKSSDPLFWTHFNIQFAVHEFQRHNSTLHYHNITYQHSYYDVLPLPCVLSVTSLRRQSLFALFNALLLTKEPSSSVPAFLLLSCFRLSLAKANGSHFKVKLWRLVQNDCPHECFKICNSLSGRYGVTLTYL